MMGKVMGNITGKSTRGLAIPLRWLADARGTLPLKSSGSRSGRPTVLNVVAGSCGQRRVGLEQAKQTFDFYVAKVHRASP
jgi:hypothetical protein